MRTDGSRWSGGSPGVYRFGAFELDATAGELRRGGLRLRATPQALRLLAYLVERPGELVTRDEIRHALWPDEHFIDYEQSINTLVRQLRIVLHDRPLAARFIETLPRRGYRFIAAVETSTAPPPALVMLPPLPLQDDEEEETAELLPEREVASPPTVEAKRPARLWPVLAAAAGLLVLAIVLVLSFRKTPPPAVPEARESGSRVLQLARFTVDAHPGSTPVALAVSEQLLQELSLLRPLGIVVADGRNAPQSPTEWSITGTVMTTEDRARVVVRLVDGRRHQELWSHAFERPLPEVSALSGEVSGAATREVVQKLVGVFRGQPQVLATWDARTMQLYNDARAKAALRTREGNSAAVHLYEEALKREPRFAEAHSGLGDMLVTIANWREPDWSKYLVRARRELQQALVLRPDLAEAHLDLGVIAFLFEHRLAFAAQSMRKAVELEPGYADAYAWLSCPLSALGEHDPALATFRLAQHLDESYEGSNVLALLYYNARRYDDALAVYRARLARQPDSPEALWGSYITLMAMRRPEAAADFQRRAIESIPEVKALAGDPKRALEVLLEKRTMPLYRAAVIHCLQGDTDLCLSRLQLAFEHHSSGCMYARVDPAFDAVRTDPRFAGLLQAPR
jgi:DNA-binding winged helix-turn-helix (wHTH) protein/tetratricopeptide (TPR) repeat protein